MGSSIALCLIMLMYPAPIVDYKEQPINIPNLRRFCKDKLPSHQYRADIDEDMLRWNVLILEMKLMNIDTMKQVIEIWEDVNVKVFENEMENRTKNMLPVYYSHIGLLRVAINQNR